MLENAHQLYEDLRGYELETWINNAGFGNYDSRRAVGLVDRESFSFRLADPLFPYAGNSSHNQQRMEAIQKTLPALCIVILAGSIISAFFYSWYMTAPIKKVSKLSKQMADIDFSGFCPVGRTDEIGVLSDSLNTLSRKLATTLSLSLYQERVTESILL